MLLKDNDEIELLYKGLFVYLRIKGERNVLIEFREIEAEEFGISSIDEFLDKCEQVYQESRLFRMLNPEITYVKRLLKVAQLVYGGLSSYEEEQNIFFTISKMIKMNVLDTIDRLTCQMHRNLVIKETIKTDNDLTLIAIEVLTGEYENISIVFIKKGVTEYQYKIIKYRNDTSDYGEILKKNMEIA